MACTHQVILKRFGKLSVCYCCGALNPLPPPPKPVKP